MEHPLFERAVKFPVRSRFVLRRAIISVAMVIMSAFICGSVSAQVAKPKTGTTTPPIANPEVKACTQGTCPGFCKDMNLQAKMYAGCVAQCTKSCIPPPPPPPAPVTVTPKYMIMAIAYAPPGCSIGSPTACGTSNGSSFVDYSTATSNGTKVTTKDSFQLGLTITYDASFLDVLSGGGSYGFQNTTSDSTAVNVTKTQANDWKVLGNGDGVDHSQDQFFLLLHPKVTLAKSGSVIQWGFNDPGAPFTVYASELRNPASARASTTQVFQELGMTSADYQDILNEDPFGGTVVSSTVGNGIHSIAGSIEATNITHATMSLGGTSGPPAPGAGLDASRFWYTDLSFPYEPAINLPNCNNGGVCNCDAFSGSLTNDKATDTGTEDDGQTTVDLQGGVTVPASYSLKIDTKLVWTTSATTDNTTENKQVASATVTCPSTNYTGPFGMEVWWDSRYGSFLLIPYDPGAVAMIHQGKVMNAANQPVSGQLVTMTYNGKTHRTYTARDGSYGFPSWSGAPAFLGSAQVSTGGVNQTVSLGKVSPIVFQMK